ncbi:MAG: HU family DNA-binding protein, partial [Candidatus Obscuribacterales bacterium]|nr:HU family DNA-binding protein [Candidatus Obscuribacterales bacterium]
MPSLEAHVFVVFFQGGNSMNRAELITEISDLTGQPKTQVSATLSAMLHSITGAVSKGDKVTLV